MFGRGGALNALHKAPKLRGVHASSRPPNLDFGPVDSSSSTTTASTLATNIGPTTPTTPSSDGKSQWWSGSADDLISRLLNAQVYDANSLQLDDCQKKKLVTLSDALSRFKRDNQIVILCFLRRFGCPVCRAVSAGISRLKSTLLKDANVQIVAISIESVGYETFAKNEYFTGPVFVNDTGSLFKLLNLKRLQLSNGYDVRKSGKMKAALALASSPHTLDNMNFDGNLVQLGGMYILSDTQDHFLMEFPEAYAGDTPLIHEVLTAVGASEELIRTATKTNDRILNLARATALERAADEDEETVHSPNKHVH